MKTVFSAKSMTFRIKRDEWDKTSTHRLNKEYDTFVAWMASIEDALPESDKIAARAAVSEWKSYLDERALVQMRRRTKHEY